MALQMHTYSRTYRACNDSFQLWYGICRTKVSHSKSEPLCIQTLSNSKLSSLMAHCLQDQVQMSQNALQHFTRAADQHLLHCSAVYLCTVFLYSTSICIFTIHLLILFVSSHQASYSNYTTWKSSTSAWKQISDIFLTPELLH